jgi:ribosomal protein S18 acetylase RimI-like enzyme
MSIESILRRKGTDVTTIAQRSFFVMKRHFSDKERAFFLDVDFGNHVAIVALTDQAGRKVVVGGGRVVFELGRAEMAFVVIDTWLGRGVGSILMRHLIKIASDAGLKELTAEVRPENAAMLKVFGKSSSSPPTPRSPDTPSDVAEDTALRSTSGSPVRVYLSPKSERR